MSYTRTRGAYMQINQNNTNVLSLTKLHVSLYTFRYINTKINKMNIPLSPFYPSNISPILQSFSSSDYTCKTRVSWPTACHKKQKGMKVTQITKNSLRYNHVK